jgi:hypothetical protein
LERHRLRTDLADLSSWSASCFTFLDVRVSAGVAWGFPFSNPIEDPEAMVVSAFLAPGALFLNMPLVEGSGATKEIGKASGIRAFGLAPVRKGNCDPGEIE